jgi:DNA topoisomerase-1
MEDSLDQIEEGKTDAVTVLKEFYQSFRQDLERAEEHMKSVRADGLAVDLRCPVCDKPLKIKIGRNGPFLACSGYPACTYTQNYTRNEKGQIEIAPPVKEEPTDEVCEKCGSPMVQKLGRFGPFLACSAYPACKNTRSLKDNARSEPQSTGVSCPEKGCGGELVCRRSRRGKVFYGCSRYPACTFAIWDKPVAKSCPQCGAPFVVERTTKKDGLHLRCLDKACAFKERLEE